MRLRFILLTIPWTLLHHAVNWLFLLLDDVFYRQYREVDVQEPLFMVGPPRSGTTFLHRLLAKDDQFTSMKLWEIVLAPSVIQKKLFRGLGSLDRRLGGQISSRIKEWEKKNLWNPMHQGGMFEPEEEEALLMLNLASGHFSMFMFPYEEDLRPLIYFDTELPPKERKRIMTFYKRCVQRHLYVFGPDKHFLSKNPAFSTKVRSLHETFPGARFVYLARDPMQSVPSNLSLYFYFLHILCPAYDTAGLVRFGIQQMLDYYLYPLQEMDRWPEDRTAVVLYDDLVGNPERTVRELYRRLGMEVTPAYSMVLSKERARARKYQSTHAYSVEQFGLLPQDIGLMFEEVYDRFGFERPAPENV